MTLHCLEKGEVKEIPVDMVTDDSWPNLFGMSQFGLRSRKVTLVAKQAGEEKPIR